MSSNLQRLKKAIIGGEDELAFSLTQEALKENLPPIKISRAIVSGIDEAGELWRKNIYFQSDMVMCADAFRAAMAVVEPHLSARDIGTAGKVIIGTVAGDMHNLGKTMVVAMLRAAKFEVTDLGEDVSAEIFINNVRELKPDILGMGCYMTTTMMEIKDIMNELRGKGLRSGVKVIVGGVPTTQEFADECGADAWGKDALEAVEKAKRLMGETK
ncbi:B12-binding domain-containing protein [Chloroflexota bacterium]